MSPFNARGKQSIHAWFDQIAKHLLIDSLLLAKGVAFRLTEIEFYYFADSHPDPFAHRDPIQLQCGRWYFHRTPGGNRGGYRSGTFKGLDLSFGDGQAYGGVLFRGMRTEFGDYIDGPCNLVDHLLAVTRFDSVADFDEAINHRLAWDQGNLLRLATNEDPPARPAIIKTARVGLSLKKQRPEVLPDRYIMQPYRYLTEPRMVKKGKSHIVLALHIEGHSTAQIQAATGSPKHVIERYIQAHQAGATTTDFTPYFGKNLNTADLCKMQGMHDARTD